MVCNVMMMGTVLYCAQIACAVPQKPALCIVNATVMMLSTVMMICTVTIMCTEVCSMMIKFNVTMKRTAMTICTMVYRSCVCCSAQTCPAYATHCNTLRIVNKCNVHCHDDVHCHDQTHYGVR